MTDYIIDDPVTEKVFQEILRRIKLMQNGVVSQSMIERGINYKVNYGVSAVALRQLALSYKPNHLLALKLWNKQWRETMILATLLEEPEKINDKQMDYWVKSIENIEIAEQCVMNLLSKLPGSFEKAVEWSLGKKRMVKVCGLLLMGRLALADKSAYDEEYEKFFEVLPPLSKDPGLTQIILRTLTHIGMRNVNLNKLTVLFAKTLLTSDSPIANGVAVQLINELDRKDVIEIIKAKETGDE